jgi:hypothetical protein
MRQIVMPLLIREISPIDLDGRNKIIKVVETEDLKGHFYVLLLLHIIAFIAFIFEYFMGKNSGFDQNYNFKIKNIENENSSFKTYSYSKRINYRKFFKEY